MSKLLTYTPQSVMIPPDIASRHSDLLRHPIDSCPQDVAINSGYALFHDVFRTVNDDKILAIGSGWRDIKKVANIEKKINVYKQVGWLEKPFYKLKDDLVPIGVTHAGEQLKIKYKTIYGHEGQKNELTYAPLMGIYEIEMSPRMRLLDKVDLTFRWRDFNIDVSVPRNSFNFQKTDLNLYTLQRNNHPLWLSDWCRYYYRQHGVKRIVIYNNLDDNPDAIAKVLRELPDEIEVLTINWPYRYHNEIYFNFSQVMEINHCPLLLSDTSKYYLNFDLDEYLVNTTNLTVTQFLDSKTDNCRRTSSLSIRQWRVPCFDTEIGKNELPRVWHFKHYFRFEPIRTSPKTINRYGRFECLWIHNTTPRWPKYCQYLLRSRWIFFYMGILHQIFPYYRYTLTIIPKKAIIVRLLRYGSHVPIVGKFVQALLVRLDHFLTIVPDLFFYHYDAIGTNWMDRSTVMKITEEQPIPTHPPIKKSQIY